MANGGTVKIVLLTWPRQKAGSLRDSNYLGDKLLIS